MKALPILLFLVLPATAGQPQTVGEENAPAGQAVNDEGSAQPTQEECCAIKRVLLLSMMHLVRERHSLPTQYVAECVAFAKRLQAPAAFIECYEVGNGGKLGGRAFYDNHRAMNALLIKYRVDELAIRLLAEEVPCTVQQARELVEWLPVQHIFNLMPPPQQITREVFDRQMSKLKQLHERMGVEYAKVVDRAGADAAADALLDTLPVLSEIQDVRLLLNKLRSENRAAFAQALGPVGKHLSELRVKLVESNFYGSVKLAVMDTLLCI